MSKDFEPSDKVYELSLINLEWTEKMPMNAPRLASSGLVFSQDYDENNYVYAIGGN